MAGEATERAIERIIGDKMEKAALKTISGLLINLFDGLLLAWSAHKDQERLQAETETACQAVKLLVAHC
ncbi:hypothetical protein D3C85_1619980 [compost metagenome]